MATRNVNYTPEMEALLVSGYNPKADEETRSAQVADLAVEFGRKPASIIAKLSNMGIYVPKVRRTKDGSATATTKEKLVAELASEMSISVDALGGMEKATKPALARVLGYIREAKSAVESAAREASDAHDAMADMEDAS